MDKLTKYKRELLNSKDKYYKSLKKYQEELWKSRLQKGMVSVVNDYEYARPMVTFGGKWDKEKYIATKKPIETEFVDIDGEIYYPKLYLSGKTYQYELYTKDEYLSKIQISHASN